MDHLKTANTGVTLKIPASREKVGAGLEVLRALPTARREAVGPFVFLDHMGPTAPPKDGVPAHPHGGIEVITYLLEGAMNHRDSLGNRSRVDSGGAQWITSGSGVLHAEFPEAAQASGRFEGVQLWIRQAASLDAQPAGYAAVTPDQVPFATLEGSANLRLIAGATPQIFGEHRGPITLSRPAMLAHLRLAPGGRATLPAPDSGFDMAAYALSGAGRIGDTALERGDLALLEPGEILVENASPGEVFSLLLLGGAPLERPLAFGGPFVFNSREAIARAYDDYSAGRMGRLDGAPA